MNEVFKALSDPTRREILRLLRDGEKSAGELAELFPLSKSTLSGHFTVLKHANLVETERQRTTIIYRLNTTVFQDVMTSLLDLFQPVSTPEPRTSTEARTEVKPS